MLEISYPEVYDLQGSVAASRFSMLTEMPDMWDAKVQQDGLERAIKLAKAGGGSGHTNFRKGIRVSFNMKYTQYITKQFQRYSFFDYVSSSSLMHRITRMDFSKCVTSYVTLADRQLMQRFVNVYNELNDIDLKDAPFAEWLALIYERVARDYAGGPLDVYRDIIDTIEQVWTTEERSSRLSMTTEYVLFMFLINKCPMGTELFVRVSTNYEQLATIYRQRKNHKLKEDWGAFCSFIESLPYANELILCEQ